MAGISTDVDIANLALGHLGKPTIVDIDGTSAEAIKSKQYYDFCRRQMLSASNWTFSSLRVVLAVLTNDRDTEWLVRYDMPNNSLKVYRLVDPHTNPSTNRPPIPFVISGGSLYCNLPEAALDYTVDHTEVSQWPEAFKDAVAARLAEKMAPHFTRRRSDIAALRGLSKELLAEAIEQDAGQAFTTYPYHVGGYVSARGAGHARGGGQVDGSTIWD